MYKELGAVGLRLRILAFKFVRGLGVGGCRFAGGWSEWGGAVDAGGCFYGC